MKTIQKKNLVDTDMANLPDGANMVYDGKQPVGVLMSVKYYAKLQALIRQVKDLMGKKDK